MGHVEAYRTLETTDHTPASIAEAIGRYAGSVFFSFADASEVLQGLSNTPAHGALDSRAAETLSSQSATHTQPFSGIGYPVDSHTLP